MNGWFHPKFSLRTSTAFLFELVSSVVFITDVVEELEVVVSSAVSKKTV